MWDGSTLARKMFSLPWPFSFEVLDGGPGTEIRRMAAPMCDIAHLTRCEAKNEWMIGNKHQPKGAFQ
jgi:hypothetical protein